VAGWTQLGELMTLAQASESAGEIGGVLPLPMLHPLSAPQSSHLQRSK